LKYCLKARAFSPVPGFGVPAFFVPDMGGGLRGGGFSGFGAPVMQYDLGGPDYPVMALVPGVGVIEIPRIAPENRSETFRKPPARTFHAEPG